MVIAVSHEINLPYDSASGLPTGKREHAPITITKELDRSSPLLYNLLATNENITEWELQFWTPRVGGTSPGTEVQHYTVQLTNARIANIRFQMLNNKNPDLMKYAEYEDLFTYQKITSELDGWRYNSIR